MSFPALTRHRMLVSIHMKPGGIVNYRGVPVPRAVMWALYDAATSGAPHFILSADRRDATLAWFNKKYGTSLHGQAYLYDGFRRGLPGFLPANPPDETSHCLRSDGNAFYGPARGHIPLVKLGNDLVDQGAQNTCVKLAAKLHDLGYRFVRPYSAGSEAHHGSFDYHDIRPLAKHARARLRKKLLTTRRLTGIMPPVPVTPDGRFAATA